MCSTPRIARHPMRSAAADFDRVPEELFFAADFLAPAFDAGRPFDVDSQALTLELALRVLETAPAARTTVQSPLRWADDPAWKLDFSNLDRMTPEQIAERRKEFEEIKAIAKAKREQA